MSDFEMTRRDFVAAGMIAGVIPLGAWAGAKEVREPGRWQRPAKFHKLLVDRNIPESVRLGTYAGSLAEDVVAYDGDLTALWTRELRLLWPDGPRPIAGLTTPNVRMVFEQLGRDHGARIVFSTEHRKVAGRVLHNLVGCETHLRSTELLGGADWVAGMARHIADCPHKTHSKQSSVTFETGYSDGLLGDQQLLVTWVLAPISWPEQEYAIETASS